MHAALCLCDDGHVQQQAACCFYTRRDTGAPRMCAAAPFPPRLLQLTCGSRKSSRALNRRSTTLTKNACRGSYITMRCCARFASQSGTLLEAMIHALTASPQWPRSPSVSPTADGGFYRGRYPVVSRMLTKPLLASQLVIRETLRNFANDPLARKQRADLVKLLTNFSKPRGGVTGPDLSELLDNSQKPDAINDSQAYIRKLHSALSSQCICQREGPESRIRANVSLRDCCPREEVEESMNIRIFFLDHPHYHSSSREAQWQDTRVFVQTRR
jgi:hypothetical protein